MCDQHLDCAESGSGFRVPGSELFWVGRAYSRAATLEFACIGSSVASPHLGSGFRVPKCDPSKSDQIRVNPSQKGSGAILGEPTIFIGAHSHSFAVSAAESLRLRPVKASRANERILQDSQEEYDSLI